MRRGVIVSIVVAMAVLVASTGVQATTPTWKVQQTPNPTGATASLLSGLSCVSAMVCTAAGHYTNSSGNEAMFVEHVSSNTWAVQKLATPSTATTAFLYAVSCSASTVCTAVGTANITGKASPAVAERWTGSGWTRQSVPTPSKSIDNALLSVACPSSSACFAVGFWMLPGGQIDPLGQEVILAEHWNGTSWAIQPIPRPSGDTFSQLSGVACTSTTACTAVGFYDSNSMQHPLAEHWNGSVWSIQTIPLPTGARGGALNSVSCVSATLCTAVGDYRNSSNVEVSLAARWSGSGWKSQTPRNPSGAKVTVLNGVSCTSSSACSTVGEYVSSSSVDVALAEGWNGTAWSIQPVPTLTGTQASFLWGIACAGSASCLAVGSYNNSSNAQLSLAERYS